MKKDKKLILIGSGISVSILAIVTSLAVAGTVTMKVKSQNEEDKYLTLDKTNTYNGSGTNSVATSTGQYVVDFKYENALTYANGHVTLSNGGTLVNTKQLKSVTYLEVNWTGSGKLQAKTSFGGGVYGSYFDIVSGHKYQFGSNPYFVTFTAIDGSVNIDSVKYYFSCVDNPEAKGTTTSKYKLVTNKSDLKTGDIVYITGKKDSGSLLSMGSTTYNTYYLKGTSVTDNEGIIESGGTEWTVTTSGDNYTFSIGNTDLYCYQSGSYFNLKFGSGSGGTNLWVWSVDSTGTGALTASNGGHLGAYNTTYFRGMNDTMYGQNDFPIYLYKKITETHWNTPKDEVGFSASDANANVYTTESIYSSDNALTVTMNYSDGTTKTLSPSEYTYKVSTDKAGTDIIDKAKAFGKSGTYYVTVSVGEHIPSIIPISVASGVTSVTANMTNTNYKTNETVVYTDNLSLTLNYEDKTTKVVKYSEFGDYGITVQLLDPNGVVHDISEPFGVAGTWTVKVTYKTFESTKNLTVSSVPVEDITVSPSSYQMYVGENVQLTVTFKPSEPTVKTVTWSSSDSAIASVDDNGLVTAHAVGSATITATSTDGGKTSSCAITVKKAATDTATINLNTGHTDSTTAMTYIATDDFDVSGITLNSVSCSNVFGSGSTSDKFVRLSSSKNSGSITFNFDAKVIKGISINAKMYKDSEEVTVSAKTNSHTTASTVKLDSTDFKYYDFSGFGSDTSESTSVTISSPSSNRFYISGIKLTLKSSEPIYPTAISLNKTETTISVNNSETLVPSYTPEDANQTETSWKSSDDSVAVVSNGIVTGKKAGSATITATVKDEQGNDLTATCVVTVQVIHVTGVSISPTSADVNIGSTQTLTPTISPSNASDKSVSYTSSNPSIAKVSDDGVVTGVSEGTVTITVTTTDGGKTATATINVLPATVGYKHIDSSELTATSKDYNNVYAPTSGTAKVLIVPITLKDSSKGSWSETEIKNLNSYFFGTGTCSFANYYKGVSHEKITMSGMVTQPYSTTISTSDLNDDMENVFDMFDAAISFVKSTYSGTNWAEYDLNSDGYFDSVHFLCNYNATDWGANLWPHQYQTNRQAGTSDSPTVNNYSLSDLYENGTKMSDSITQIHEQGHIFGIDDYYNYTSNNNADYVGSADMQDYNMFEWNSFSKLSAGWASPYVVDGTSNSFTLTMNSAATSEDCLIIPADYSTWNGSAFDEYFVVELFTNTGLNNYFWSDYVNNYSSYGASLPSTGYGVRIYHVDGRVSKSSGGDQIDPKDWDLSKYSYIQGCNNSSTASSYPTYNSKWSNFAILQLVQATGTNTHSSVAFMGKNDLFTTGDTFNWAKAKYFLRKDGSAVSTMDDGETFPWTITFTAMSKTSVTMTITHN